MSLKMLYQCSFIAFKILNINPEEVIYRQIDRMQHQPVTTMHVFSNKVEIRVGNEVRGGWTYF